MTNRQRRNILIIRDFKQLLGSAPIMNIYAQLGDKYFLDIDTVRTIIRKRQKVATT